MALFAALSYAVTKSGEGVNSNFTTDTKAQLLASRLVAYVGEAQLAVTRLNLRGVENENILFDRPGNNDFLNNVERQIFHPQGGGMIHKDFPIFNDLWQNKTNVEWTSSPATDIILAINTYGNDESFVGQKVCKIINTKLTGSPDIPEIDYRTDNREYFDHRFSTAKNFTTSLCPDCDGHQSLCIFRARGNGAAEDSYVFYNIVGSK